MNQKDWFSSSEHETAVSRFISAEAERLSAVVQKDGALMGVSLCIAMLSAYPVFMKSLGLKDIAVQMLTDALDQAKDAR